MGKTITFSLDKASIEAAIAELEAYINGIRDKCAVLRIFVAEWIKEKAEYEYEVAVGQINLVGEDDGKDVWVRVSHGEDAMTVIVSGKDAAFLEFGAGVFFNGPEGHSPHPWGEEMGMLIGRYGEGQGAMQAWAYGDVITRGTPASKGLYTATMELIHSGELERMYREVFG